jgi:hypothetical protein
MGKYCQDDCDCAMAQCANQKPPQPDEASSNKKRKRNVDDNEASSAGEEIKQIRETFAYMRREATARAAQAKLQDQQNDAAGMIVQTPPADDPRHLFAQTALARTLVDLHHITDSTNKQVEAWKIEQHQGQYAEQQSARLLHMTPYPYLKAGAPTSYGEEEITPELLIKQETIWIKSLTETIQRRTREMKIRRDAANATNATL